MSVRAYKLAGARGYYYVLPGWLDTQGQLIKEYEDKIFFKYKVDDNPKR